MKLAVLGLLPVLAVAQTYSSHSGWNFDDTLHAATDVVVGRITAGSGVDSGADVRATAVVSVIRVLQGSLTTGMQVSLTWQYQPAPNEGPAVTSVIPKTTSLFFLRKSTSGGFEPLRAGGMMTMGGVILPVPASAPSSTLLYTPDQPLAGKLAREFGAAMQDLALREPAALLLRPSNPAARAASVNYQSLAMALDSIEKPQALPVFQYLATLSDINLRTAGLLGRLAAGDASAIFEVERDLPRIAASAAAGRFGPGIMTFDPSRDLAAAHALARIGLSETPLPGLEGSMAFRLAGTRKPEFLPYLFIMLGNPDSSIRGAAIMAVCTLVAPMGDRTQPQGLWRPEMNAYCPDHSPQNDADLERRDIEYWNTWWNANREEIAKTAVLPNVIAPSRYNAGPPAGLVEITEIPLEVRLQSLLGMRASRNQTTHYHNGSEVVEGTPPGPPDPVSGQLGEADRAAYSRILDATNTKLAANRERAMTVVNAARVAGTPAEPSRFQSIEAERQALLSAAIQELRTGLSPEGWQSLERFLMNMGIRMMRAVPAK